VYFCRYKYIIKDKESGHVVKWEDGDNRFFELSLNARQNITKKTTYTVIAQDVFRVRSSIHKRSQNEQIQTKKKSNKTK
jgi:hypothetical protein